MAYVTVDQEELDLNGLNWPVGRTLENAGFEVYRADGDEHLQAYESIKRGRCMLCDNPLREDTIVVVGAEGILGLWCDGECLTDSQAIGFLQSMIHSILEAHELGGGDAEDQSGKDE